MWDRAEAVCVVPAEIYFFVFRFESIIILLSCEVSVTLQLVSRRVEEFLRVIVHRCVRTNRTDSTCEAVHPEWLRAQV